jgi:hypothetical protein
VIGFYLHVLVRSQVVQALEAVRLYRASAAEFAIDSVAAYAYSMRAGA